MRQPRLTVKGCIGVTSSLQHHSKVSKVYVHLYNAFRKAPLTRSDMDRTVLPANYIMPAFTPQPQSTTRLLAGTHSTVPRKVEG